ncbi:WXG100 family type VII secretion target [Nocardia sp. KC 131]|uniref:WXG100 family type VII secretion target n=1 Tax=Nocardia arseniciresistens TaxID=3392119 RepID=UPI00398EA30A
MLYDPKYLLPLIDQLDAHYKSLHTEIGHLETAADKLVNVAWEDNESAMGFKNAHKKWEQEFSDTATKLENLRDAVDRALGNAQSADQKVYDSFAGM